MTLPCTRALRSIALLVALGLAPGGCSVSPASTQRCVFESGVVSTGTCLTRCQSLCSLEVRAGCAATDCTATCEDAAGAQSSACNDATYAHWRCLRVQSLPSVACSEGRPVVSDPPSACVTERERERAACGAPDGATDSS